MESKDNNIIHLDSNKIEWKFGTIPFISEGEGDGGYFIGFPVQIEPMYPENQSTSQFCCCCICHQSILGLGFIVLKFNSNHWCVKLGCTDCFSFNSVIVICHHLLIVEVESQIKPKIDAACRENSHKCLVCEKRFCKDKECHEVLEKGLLYKDINEKLLEHFYQVKLNLLDILYKSIVCCICHKQRVTKKCNVCKLRYYCGKKCKREDINQHKCEPFELIWRK